MKNPFAIQNEADAIRQSQPTRVCVTDSGLAALLSKSGFLRRVTDKYPELRQQVRIADASAAYGPETKFIHLPLSMVELLNEFPTKTWADAQVVEALIASAVARIENELTHPQWAADS